MGYWNYPNDSYNQWKMEGIVSIEKPQIKVEIPLLEPNRKNIRGKAGEFVDDFLLSYKMQGAFYGMGVEPDKTFLVFGPCGTGKSLAMKVITNEANKDLDIESRMNPKKHNLVTMAYDIGQYGTAYINEGSRIIQGFFDTAYGMARRKSVLLVLDECDALFRSRTSSVHSHSEDMKNLETLMKNLQEAHDTKNIFVTLITNLEEILDKASIRSGRIDKKVKFPLPNLEERRDAFEYEINQVNKKADYKVIRKYNLDELAEKTDKTNYADINNIVHIAVKRKIIEIFNEDSKRIVFAPYITQKYLLEESEKIKPEERTIGFKLKYEKNK